MLILIHNTNRPSKHTNENSFLQVLENPDLSRCGAVITDLPLDDKALIKPYKWDVFVFLCNARTGSLEGYSGNGEGSTSRSLTKPRKASLKIDFIARSFTIKDKFCYGL